MIAWYTQNEFPAWVQAFFPKMVPDEVQQITGTLSVVKGQGDAIGLQTWVEGAIPTIEEVPTKYPAASGPLLFRPNSI